MDYKEMTLEDVEQLNEEIDHFYKMRKLLLGLGWGSIGLGFILVFFFISSEPMMRLFGYLSPISICAGVIILILRGPLYNRRIRNRKILVKKAIEYRKNKQLFEDTGE